jgi:LmbE family N-acetylglucosaminyl deacetylase
MAPRFKWVGLVAAGLALAWPAEGQYAPLPHDRGVSGLGLALRRLAVTARVLYVTAHPDDEHNPMLVTLSRGRGVTTALLTLTRGDGGQNAIGTELDEALAVLRTEELAAVHRYDGARQYFGQAAEFGFSLSLDETLARWGAEATLGDVVRVVRAFRPDVVLCMPLAASGHQHHVASARLAREAFRAAADPGRFPEQLAGGLRPWQARKLYQSGVGGGDPTAMPTLELRTGTFDPLLGMSWAEFGGLARSFHKSQSTRQLRLTPGEVTTARLVLTDAVPPEVEGEDDLMAGVDPSLLGLLRFASSEQAERLRPGLAGVQEQAIRAGAALDPFHPEATLVPLRAGLEQLRALREKLHDLPAGGGLIEIAERLEQNEAEFEQALFRAHGLAFQATADDGDVVPGQTFRVTASVFNQGREPVEVQDLALAVTRGWTSSRVSGDPGALAAGSGLTIAYDVTAGKEARFSSPYWRLVPGTDRYALDPESHRGLPWSPADVVARLRFASAGVAAHAEQPAIWRYPGRWVGGEKQKTVNVVPELAVGISPERAVFPRSGPRPPTREFTVTVSTQRRQGAPAGTLRLSAPLGWRVEPAEVPLRLASEGDEASARFRVTPPTGVAAGEHEIRAVVACEGREFAGGFQAIAYDHVEERHLVRPARALARSLDVRVAPAARIGYVMGTGDAVPEAIRQLGLPVELLDDRAFEDLDRFSTIALGVRAYRTRPDLRAHHGRLMAWVERGGHLVVQYQNEDFNAPDDGASPYAPFPASIGRRRITDETSPVVMLQTSASVLRTPNRIGEDDWKGWRQDRATQLLDAKDARYVELVASPDPLAVDPAPQRGLLVEATVGQGTWTYVGLALFRQLPAGVPGAYRLLANLVSRPPPRRGA